MMRINLGLQGGGAHGAFTWGVLDRLLQEPELEIASISGTSAGALNAAALKSGWITGGAEAARENLDWLWAQMGALRDDRLPHWMRAWLPDAGQTGHMLSLSPPYLMADALSSLTTPYAMGPIYENPLRRIVDRFHYDRVCADQGPVLFVGATCVRDGKIRIFQNEQITSDALLASACLPTLFQSVECRDPKTGKQEAFWDGGYTGNPALFPMFRDDLPADIVVVNINPLERNSQPVTPHEIQNRINEISFNSSLLRELRAITFVQRLIEQGRLSDDAMRSPRIHMIADDALMTRLSVATKLVPIPHVLQELKDAGRVAAETFLAQHRADIGVRQTSDLRGMFG